LVFFRQFCRKNPLNIFPNPFVWLNSTSFVLPAQQNIGYHEKKLVVLSSLSVTAYNKNMSLNSEQKSITEKFTNFFENSTLEPQYGYAENLDDGRGITAGRCGFTTGTDDAHIVVKKYTELVGDNILSKYLPELQRLDHADDDEKDNTDNLDSFEHAWKEAAKDERFRQVQDAINDELYFQPSQEYADKYGLNIALSRAALYDACIQHGIGDDADSLNSMLSRTKKAMNGTPIDGVDEAAWLGKFLEIRKATLLNPADEDSQEEWAESAERVDVYSNLLEQNNFELTPPIRIKCFGDSVTIS
jgi:chitosanase